jgi:hypothetical protein
MLETKPEAKTNSDLLTVAQAAIGKGLQSYYQFVSLEPTPNRLRILLAEMQQRTKAAFEK